jgi:predicted RecA/RadA family phage recombinase
MAANIIYSEGDQLEVAVLSGTESGDPVVWGNQPGVALIDRDASTGKATVKFSGVVALTLAGATAEDAVYIDPADYSLTLTDDADNVFYGVALTDSDADDIVHVRIGGIEPGSGS